MIKTINMEIKPNNKASFLGLPIIYPPVKLSFDPSSAYCFHSVLVRNDVSLNGVGNNKDGRIDIDDFTDFSIKDVNIR